MPNKIELEVSEYTKYERSLLWYVITFAVGAGLLIYAILTSNFLFAVILVLITVIIIIMSFNQPRILKMVIDPTGIRIGGKKYEFRKFKNFSVIYEPPDVNTLYLEFDMPLRDRLSIPLGDADPNMVREYLLNYIVEDLERDDESLTDITSRIAKF